MKQNIGIIGHGEVGDSLFRIYKKHSNYSVFVNDTRYEHNQYMRDVYILNICYPYSDTFINDTRLYIKTINPKMTVIHSTVPPGTTKELYDGLLDNDICYSPVRGKHPDLEIGIKTFVKWIGSESCMVAKEYATHLRELGIDSYICKDSKTAEFAKLLDTAYYGVCIAFHNDALKVCEEHDLDFTEVMTDYNKTYNEGYKSLNKSGYVRPVLYGGTKIGGHCVVPNAKLLKPFMDTDLVNSILRYE